MHFMGKASGISALVCIFCLSAVWCNNKECYNAKICIHNGREKCGLDKNGDVRMFLDSCDILEFNCLMGTEYAKTDMAKCNKLVPLHNDKKTMKTTPKLSVQRKALAGRIAITNDYWCWRSKYCHTAGTPVCGYEGRLNIKIKFPSECNLFKHNCRNKHDFRIISDKKCKTKLTKKSKITTAVTPSDIIFVTIE